MREVSGREAATEWRVVTLPAFIITNYERQQYDYGRIENN